ncbi:MAG TPA: class I SAM-dependent methyltransferase [Intrasporangium sp.]|uniref:class I SAM-dependent methyltransferase n=1 Tax=Intrasporangium sp. TaxID=1925024 RepID=UPI002D796AFC|nr:class I SAM-dependent methyltransferase [Intrasporangium sp.]HET7400113.1 class I SAM-dependent methyltransferase [Intrasporangium sp.]
MSPDERAVLDRALLGARLTAYPHGEFVGQESFMSASEVLTLARRAGIAPGVSVLDVCCGVAGPGRLIAAELGCAYLGVDASSSAIEIARERAEVPCEFRVGRIPPLPAGPFDVVLLLETMLAFPDKQSLLAGVSAALPPGGRFAFTVEEGPALTSTERALMPAADTVWPVPLPELLSALEGQGLRVRWHADWTASHRSTVDSLLRAFRAEDAHLRARLGDRAVDDLLAAHGCWSEWLRDGRVRKFAFVAEQDQAQRGGGRVPAPARTVASQ